MSELEINPTDQEVDINSAGLCVGRGIYYSLKDQPGAKYQIEGKPPLTWPAILWLAKHPSNTPKKDGLWFIPSAYIEHDARYDIPQFDNGEYWVLCFDIDKGNKSKDEVRAAFRELYDVEQLLIYSTKSATEDNKKWRVMIPCAEPFSATIYQALLHYSNNFLEEQGLDLDRALEQPKQLVFLPNRNDEFYEFDISGDKLLVGPPGMLENLVREFEAETAEARKQLGNYKPLPLFKEDGKTLNAITVLNRTTTIEAELRAYGATQRGCRWLSPLSDSGTPGINILQSRKGLWDVTYCHHASDKFIGGRICDPAEIRIQRMIKDGTATSVEQARRELFQEVIIDAAKLCDPETGEIDQRLTAWEGRTVHEYNEAVRVNARQAALDAEQPVIEEPEPEDIDDGDWTTPTPTPAPQLKRTAPMKDMPIAVYNRMFPTAPQPFPYHNPEIQLPGLLGYFAHRLALLPTMNTENGGLLASIPLFAAIVGDTIATAGTQTRTNLNIIVLDDSGEGKTSLVNELRNVATVARVDSRIGAGYFTSGPGIIKKVNEADGPLACYVDEIGKMFRRATEGKGDPHAISAINTITKLYSASNILEKGEAAATKATPDLDHPHLSIFGASTPEVFWGAFTSGNLTDGAIARYMPAPLGDGRPQWLPDGERAGLVSGLAGHLEAFAEYITSFKGSKQEPYRVQWQPGVEDERRSMTHTMLAAAKVARGGGQEGCAEVIRRVAENAAKLTLIQALARNYMLPAEQRDNSISQEDLNFGYDLALWCAVFMVQQLPKYGVGEGKRGKLMIEIVETVRMGLQGQPRKTLPVENGFILAGKVKNYRREFRDTDKHIWEQVIDELQEAGKLRVIASPTGKGRLVGLP